ncbi:MAG TPA: Stk1 family PASTA domain-containing Ser/Thr kinase [Solirubrobacteraceae bacterium]|jgi:serine/threonine-protein kinase
MVEAGTIIDGRYEVLSRIGSGGMADVYLAQDALLGRQVALKLLQHRFAQDQEFVERFRREASSAAGLSHPNVVSIFDRGEWDGTYYIAMEYLPGRTLKAMVREGGPMDPASAIEIVIQILRAAKFAHKRGIIHRDLKPHNVILDEEGRAKVTDFGIARAGASDMTLTGSIMGTAQYLSPEQAQGQSVSETSDLYAVGIVLYELLTGAVPFDGETAVTIALKQVSAEPPPPSLLNPAVSPELDAVVARALAKSPLERFADAAEFIAVLEQARAQIGLAPSSPPPVTNGPVFPPTAIANAPMMVPTGAPAALLLAASEEDEDPGGESWWQRYRWWVLGTVALLAILGTALALVLTANNKVSVPALTGLTQTQAVARLSHAGLTASPSQAASATVASGTVISQSPKANSNVKKGTRVSIVVSSGPGSLALPNVVGQTAAQATAALQAAGLKPTTQSQASTKVKQGLVISTDPSAGTELQEGSPVTVLVSSGPQQVAVPEVTGSSEAEAKATLKAAGLKLGTVTQQSSNEQAPGTVLSQSPVSGTQLAAGQAVNLTVAQAPKEVAVPEVVGQNETQAAAALGRAGFNPKSVSRTVTDPKQVGVVLKQSPASGNMAPRGATVTIAVGELTQTGSATETTPTTTTPPATTTTTTTPVAGNAPAAPVP